MTTPASRIDTLINKEKERVEVLTVRALSYLGELCVIEARNRPQEISWYDRSGNLRSVKLFLSGDIVRECEVKGFHRYQLYAKLWV